MKRLGVRRSPCFLLAVLFVVLPSVCVWGDEVVTHLDFYPGGRIKPGQLAEVLTVFVHVPATDPRFDAEDRKTWVLPTDQDLARLSQAPKLQRLDLVGGRITSHGVRQLRSLSDLSHLTIRQAKVDDELLAEIARLPNLKELRLLDCSLPDHAAKHLERMVKLKELSLLGCELHDDFLAKHSLPDGLEVLDISRTNAACSFISRLPVSLIELRASEIAIEEACLPQLEKLTHLKTLKIDSPELSSGSIKKLGERMPETRVNGHIFRGQ